VSFLNPNYHFSGLPRPRWGRMGN